MRRLGFYTIAVAASAVATAVLGDAVLRINIARREHLASSCPFSVVGGAQGRGGFGVSWGGKAV